MEDETKMTSGATSEPLAELGEIENPFSAEDGLSSNEISRYSRQLILPEIGMSGQLLLKKTSVLIVGAGGLGCPVGIYLAAAGVGHIGIVDHDVVDMSNLHRQIAHTVNSVGNAKSQSLKRALMEINPDIQCTTYPLLLNSKNIEQVIEPYSIIVDASDNVPTRYLLNDAAVLFKKYLVSGSALRFEGQLTVYNYLDGPCYRCLYPTPPNAGVTTNCSEGGVMGALTGVIGSLQALEVIKLAVGLEPSYYKKLLLFDGLCGDMRIIKLRSKKPDCAVCGEQPIIKKLIDYEVFCNTKATDKDETVSILSESERISCTEYKKLRDKGYKHILVDVRSPTELDICRLPKVLNIPMHKLEDKGAIFLLKRMIEERDCKDNFVLCRRGNDSQLAVRLLQKHIPDCVWRDIKGGLYAWHDEIDPTLPLY